MEFSMESTPRIAPAQVPYTPAVQAAMGQLLRPGMPAPQVFATVARNEGLFAFLVDSGLLGPTGLLDRGMLERPLRECVILRTCVAARNDYEFNLHVQTISRRMGLSDAQIDDVRRPAPVATLWNAQQMAAMRLVDALVALRVDDDVFAQARSEFDEPMLIELTQLVGLYVGVAMQVALARPSYDRYQPGPPVTASA
jgi:4-carboxymuconolactone decarboxylase